MAPGLKDSNIITLYLPLDSVSNQVEPQLPHGQGLSQGEKVMVLLSYCLTSKTRWPGSVNTTTRVIVSFWQRPVNFLDAQTAHSRNTQTSSFLPPFFFSVAIGPISILSHSSIGRKPPTTSTRFNEEVHILNKVYGAIDFTTEDVHYCAAFQHPAPLTLISPIISWGYIG